MWGKTTAALFCGLPLSVALIGIAALLWPGSGDLWVLPWLLLFFPLWIVAMSISFIFRSGKIAWLIMAGLTLLSHVLLYILKQQ